MGPKPYKNQEFPYNSPIFAFWQRRASIICCFPIGCMCLACFSQAKARQCIGNCLMLRGGLGPSKTGGISYPTQPAA